MPPRLQAPWSRARPRFAALHGDFRRYAIDALMAYHRAWLMPAPDASQSRQVPALHPQHRSRSNAGIQAHHSPVVGPSRPPVGISLYCYPKRELLLAILAPSRSPGVHCPEAVTRFGGSRMATLAALGKYLTTSRSRPITATVTAVPRFLARHRGIVRA